MKKIGKIETVASLVYKAYEVMETEGRCYAGVDAFAYPHNRHDLRALECLVIPGEWRWTEQYAPCQPDYGLPPQNAKGKYDVVKGDEARRVLEDILTRHETGCLALNDTTSPYVIPINHSYQSGKLYMHCGRQGKKLGLLRRCPSATYMLYGTAQAVPPGVRSCHLPYESILFYGQVFVVEDLAEKEAAIHTLTTQYGTPHQHGFADMIEVLVFHIHHATARTGRFMPGKNRKLYHCTFAGGEQGE